MYDLFSIIFMLTAFLGCREDIDLFFKFINSAALFAIAGSIYSLNLNFKKIADNFKFNVDRIELEKDEKDEK